MKLTKAQCWIILLICIVPYSQGGIVWDDHILLTEGLWTQGSIIDIWTQHVQGGDVAKQYYRPIPMTIMSTIRSAFGLHLFALLIHIGSSFLVRDWIAQETTSTRLQILGQVLFALHPINTEVLGWISCLPDILAVHFALWSVWCAHRTRWSVAGGCLCLGMLSKEIAFIPFLVWLLFRRSRIAGMICTVVLGLVVCLRWFLGVESGELPSDQIWQVSWRVLGQAMWGWLSPLNHFPVRDIFALPDWKAIGGILVLVVLWTNNRKYWPFWLLSLLAIFSSLPPILVGYLAAERYLYLASVGWTIGVVLSTQQLLKMIPQRVFKIAILLTAMVLGSIHWVRAPIWSNDTQLFDHAVNVLPNSAYTWHLRGIVAMKNQNPISAAYYFQQACERERPHYLDYHLALQALILSEQYAEAFKWAESGPKENLTKEYLILWLQAAQKVQAHNRAQEIELMLESPSP